MKSTIKQQSDSINVNANNEDTMINEDKNQQLSVSEWDKNLITTEGNQDYVETLPDVVKMGNLKGDSSQNQGITQSQKTLQGTERRISNKFSNQIGAKNVQSESHPEEQLTIMEEEIVTNTDLNQSQQNITSIQNMGLPLHSSSKKVLRKETGDTVIDASKTTETNNLDKDMELNTIQDKAHVRRNQERQNTLTQMQNQKMNIKIDQLTQPDSILQIQPSDKNLEFYPAQSERSRLVANQSQIQFLGLNNQPSETSTNNLLMYSQSVKMNDIESTIHNINNQSMMQSEFDQKMIDRLILEESEKLLKKKGDLDQDFEIMKKLKEMQIRPGGSMVGLGPGQPGNLTDEQMRAMLVMGQQNLQNLGNMISQGMMSGNLPDESINFSNLDSSINPSQYNEPHSNRNQKERNQHKLHQQQILKAASLIESQQPNKKLKTNFSTAGGDQKGSKLSQEQHRQEKLEKKNRQISPQKKKKTVENQAKTQPNEPNHDSNQKTQKLQVKEAIKAAQKLQGLADADISRDLSNSAQVKIKVDSPSKAGKNALSMKKITQSPTQVQSKKLKLDRRQSNQEQTAPKDLGRDLLLGQPLLSDTEMTSFFTPTQTDHFENELNQILKSKRQTDSELNKRQVATKGKSDREQKKQPANETKNAEQASKTQVQPQQQKQNGKKVPESSPAAQKSGSDFLSLNQIISNKGSMNTPQQKIEGALNTQTGSNSLNQTTSAVVVPEVPQTQQPAATKAQPLGFHKYTQITKQNVEKKEQREKEKAERKAGDMSTQMTNQNTNPAIVTTTNNNNNLDDEADIVDEMGGPVASLSLAQYFEKMNVNKNVKKKGLEVVTTDMRPTRVEISPIDTANSAMMRYSKIIDNEDEQLFDQMEKKESRGRDAAAAAQKPPNSNTKISRKSKKEYSYSPVKKNNKSDGRLKSRDNVINHEVSNFQQNLQNSSQEPLRFDDADAVAARARPNSQGNSRQVRRPQMINTQSQGQQANQEQAMIVEQKIENIQNQYNQYNQIIVASGDLVLNQAGDPIRNNQQRLPHELRKPPGTAGQPHQNSNALGSRGMPRKTPGAITGAVIYPGSMIHHEDQSSYLNGLSGYDEFANKGGGPISDIQGYPPQNMSNVPGLNPMNVTHDGRNNQGHHFGGPMNHGNTTVANGGYVPFDHYDNDEDNFIQNDDGSQSANLMMLDGEYDHFLYNNPQNINQSIGSSMGQSSRAKLQAMSKNIRVEQYPLSGNKTHGSHALQSFDNRVFQQTFHSGLVIQHAHANNQQPINSREFIVPNMKDKGARGTVVNNKQNGAVLLVQGQRNYDNGYQLGQDIKNQLRGGPWPQQYAPQLRIQSSQTQIATNMASHAKEKVDKNQVMPSFNIDYSNAKNDDILKQSQIDNSQKKESAAGQGANNQLLGNIQAPLLRASQNNQLFPSKFEVAAPVNPKEQKQLKIMTSGPAYTMLDSSKYLLDNKDHSVQPNTFVFKVTATRDLMDKFKKFRVKIKKRYGDNPVEQDTIKRKIGDFLKQYEQSRTKKLSKIDKLKMLLPPSVLLRIVQHMQTRDTYKLMAVNKYIRRTMMYESEFEGQWVIKSFQSLLSKSGFSGIRNNNLRKIDVQLRPMHFQCQSVVQDAIDDQWHLLGIWWNAAFVLVFFVTPIILVVNEEKEFKWPMSVLMVPTSFAWLLLIVTMFMINQKATKYHQRVSNLHLTSSNYKSNSMMTQMGQPRGRITAHCSVYKVEAFKSRMLSMIANSCILCYLGVILKVYVFDILNTYEILATATFRMDWTMTLMICYAPLMFLYCKEIIGEGYASQRNLKNNRELLMRLAHQSVDKNVKHVDINEVPTPIGLKKHELVKVENIFNSHQRNAKFLDYQGIFFNLVLIPLGVLAFLFLLAQRLDGRNKISFFILIIPLWIISLPIFAYIIINGLAAQNTRINNCEKVSLSVLIPLGFLITLILLMWYAESEDRWKNGEKLLKILFIPHLVSLMSLYLYLRCLVRQIKKVHNHQGNPKDGQSQGKQAA